MAIAWFLMPYKWKQVDRGRVKAERWCAVEDYRSLINADKGDADYAEVLGNMGVVKVRANDVTLSAIAAEPGTIRLPKTLLTASLSDLTTAQKTTINDKLIDMGYATNQIKTALGTDIGTKTLMDVLKFAATRRLKPRWDAVNNQVAVDGAEQSCRPIDDVDRAVV